MGAESLPALITITAAVAAMGGLQGLVQWGAYGKPKPVCRGRWDLMLDERDIKLKEEASAAAKVQRLLAWNRAGLSIIC